MCEYCGCQAIRSISELTQEHEAALDHIRAGLQAATNGDRQAAAEAACRLLMLLGPHTAVEEHALFPAMAREYPEHVATLIAEHCEVHTALTAAAAADGVAGAWQSVLTNALDVLREHILKEQDGLFPAALTSLGTGDWHAVEVERARVGSALRLGMNA